jgi:serine protease Do/serine protease DegQ
MTRIIPALLLAFAAAIPAGASTLPPPVNGQPMPSLAPMIAQVTPGVVNISVVARAEDNPLMRDPFYRRFLEQPDRPQRQERAAGSGVIIDAERGLVITNNHVVKDAREVVVTLKDRRQFPAQLVGSDPGTDIALLRIPADALTAVRIGDSDAMNVGDYVVAIGNPFGIGQTVTSGIVSAVGRSSGITPSGYEEFIQTDASINPGNSGGALVNLRGELIGVNTAIIGPSGGNVGIGFAVPSNMARAVVEQIVKYGEVKRGRIGVTTQDVTPDVAKKLGLRVTEGALVERVEPKSPAEQAGLQVRDVVVAANGRPVRTSGELRNRVGLTPVGEELDLRILRGGQERELKLRVGDAAQAMAEIPGEAVPQLAGARVANIAPGMPLHGQVEAVVVTAVERDSAAYRNGLRRGDVILGVGRQRVRTVDEFLTALRNAEAPIRLSLVRGDSRLALVIR